MGLTMTHSKFASKEQKD